MFVISIAATAWGSTCEPTEDCFHDAIDFDYGNARIELPPINPFDGTHRYLDVEAPLSEMVRSWDGLKANACFLSEQGSIHCAGQIKTHKPCASRHSLPTCFGIVDRDGDVVPD